MVLGAASAQQRHCSAAIAGGRRRCAAPHRRQQQRLRRRQRLAVSAAFSLDSSLLSLLKRNAEAAGGGAKNGVARATVATLPFLRTEVQPHSSKPVTPVAPEDKDTVERLLYLTKLAKDVRSVKAAQFMEEGIKLVTTSNQCEGLAVPLPTGTFDGDEGDGMALALSEVRKAAELMSAGVEGMQSALEPAVLTAQKAFNNTTSSNKMEFATGHGVHGKTGEAAEDEQGLAHRVQRVQSRISKAAAAAVAAAEPLASSMTKNVSSITQKLPSSNSGSRKKSGSPMYGDPKSGWMVCDDMRGRVRYLVITAPESLENNPRLFNQDLTAFETYGLGVKVNKKVYAEACALYARFIPLVLEYLDEVPGGRIALTGAGVGGSLAAALLLMFVHRGLSRSSFEPVYTFGSPAALCETPDYSKWCNAAGCTLTEVDEMIEELVQRGVLAELGLRGDAVRNVYFSVADASGTSQKDAAVLDFLKSWLLQSVGAGNRIPPDSGLRRSLGETAAKGVAAGNLQFFSPIGSVLLYEDGSY